MPKLTRRDMAHKGGGNYILCESIILLPPPRVKWNRHLKERSISSRQPLHLHNLFHCIDFRAACDDCAARMLRSGNGKSVGIRNGVMCLDVGGGKDGLLVGGKNFDRQLPNQRQRILRLLCPASSFGDRAFPQG